MWSFGHFTLRLPYDFEDRYTFAEFYLLHDRWVDAEAHAEYRASLIATTLCNINRSQHAQALDSGAFMRQPFAKEPTEIGEISPELMHQKLKFAFGAPDEPQATEAGGAS